jgi:hypothetical protein
MKRDRIDTRESFSALIQCRRRQWNIYKRVLEREEENGG